MKIHIFLRFFANIFVCWKPYLPLALYLFCVMLKNRTIATFYYFLELRKERKELKGTVSVISSDPPCKAGHTWFTTLPLKPFSFNNVEDIVVFLGLKVFVSENSYMFACSRNAPVTYAEKPNLTLKRFSNYKHGYLIYAWADKAFKGTVVYIRYCHLCMEQRSLQNTVTVPLSRGHFPVFLSRYTKLTICT